MTFKKLKIENLKKSILSLEKAVEKCNSLPPSSDLKEFIRDGAIQRFEFTYELAWKTLKRFLEVYMLEHVDSLIGANLFRLGHEAGLIKNVDAWLEFKRNRNLTSHVYDEHVAHEVYQCFASFIDEVNYFVERIEEKTQ